ncbi:flippase [uncultured Treponema sp.]|uniref:flippase n=1 Tax=uncultured Treponema sp. TaxID=162155 RepID=UPI0025FB3134|nr:flippase [uncultured Treponema sp.]
MKEKSLKLNAVLNITKQCMNLLFPLITFPYSSRILNADGIGKVNFALSIVSYFTLLAGLGIGSYATREAAKIRDNKILLAKFTKEIFTINFTTTFISYLLFFIALFAVPRFSDYRVLLCICSSTILFGTLGFEWLYNAKEEYVYTTVRGICFQVLSLILLFTLVKTKDDYVKYASINVISSAGSNILNFINLRKLVDFKVKAKKEIKKHFRPILILFASAVAVSLYNELDKTMIGFLANDEQVGFYSASTKITKLVIALITAILTVISPRLSNYAENNKEKFFELLEKTFNIILMLSLPFMFGLIVMARPLTLLFCGENFEPSVRIMQVMSVIIFMIPLATFCSSQVFIPLRKDKYTFYPVCVGAVVNAIFNVFLILKFGGFGAGIATIIAESSVTFASFVLVKKSEVSIGKLFRNFWQYLLAGIVMAVVVFLLGKLMPSNVVFIFAQILCGCVVYFSVLLIFRNTYVNGVFASVVNC